VKKVFSPILGIVLEHVINWAFDNLNFFGRVRTSHFAI